MNTIYGLPIIIQQDWPKRQLDPNVTVSKEFRAYINAWMIDFFGYTNLLPDGQIVKLGNKIAMNPRTYNQVKEAYEIENQI